MPISTQPLMTVAEVAEVLGVGERFVRRLVAERRLPYLKIGAKVRFTHEDLEAFVAASRREVGVTLEPEDLWTTVLGLEQPEFLESGVPCRAASAEAPVNDGQSGKMCL